MIDVVIEILRPRLKCRVRAWVSVWVDARQEGLMAAVDDEAEVIDGNRPHGSKVPLNAAEKLEARREVCRLLERHGRRREERRELAKTDAVYGVDMD